MSKNAIVTGISGQDGAYLAENLLNRGYTVYGTYRRTSSVNFWRIDELGISNHPQLKLVEYDLTDMGSAIRLIETSEATGVSASPPSATTHVPARATRAAICPILLFMPVAPRKICAQSFPRLSAFKLKGQ